MSDSSCHRIYICSASKAVTTVNAIECHENSPPARLLLQIPPEMGLHVVKAGCGPGVEEMMSWWNNVVGFTFRLKEQSSAGAGKSYR